KNSTVRRLRPSRSGRSASDRSVSLDVPSNYSCSTLLAAFARISGIALGACGFVLSRGRHAARLGLFLLLPRALLDVVAVGLREITLDRVVLELDRRLLLVFDRVASDRGLHRLLLRWCEKGFAALRGVGRR